ncbi:MAG: hypothetical protein AAGA58_03655 [Verrucomicrobiota bacterium]
MSTRVKESGLPSAWTKPKEVARLHLLCAHSASKAVVIRRKPSKRVHLISWDTAADAIEHGSWFNGKIYAERCDLSWDGQWMVYLAMGSNGETWNGICKPPWLRTIADVPNVGTWAGGGYFSGKRMLQSNDVWHSDRSLSEFSKSKQFPFSIERMESGGEVFPILSHRLERDGWKREGEFGKEKKISLKHSGYSALCLDDPGWSWQPTSEHPVLRMFYRGYLVRGYTFEFRLDGSDLLDADVDWATWDAKGELLVAREGSIQRYSLKGLSQGRPDFSLNLESLHPPTDDESDTSQGADLR